MSDDPATLLAELRAHEAALVFDRFDEDDAWRLGVQLVEAARAEQLPIAISIRRNGQRLFHAALPGASADNDAWLDRKCRVVDRYSTSSYAVGTAFVVDGTTFDESSRLDTAVYAAHGGAFPVRIKGVGVVGTVGVSGLPQADDHAFVVRELGRFLGVPAEPTA